MDHGEGVLGPRLSGKFIVLDGPDGCGKSTQVQLLVERLCDRGTPVVRFRDPGDTAIGEEIRRLLLSRQYIGMETRTELMLYMAARAQLWAEKISPALAAGKCVVLDRWVSSSCAYQGYAGGFGIEEVVAVAQRSLERVWPDLTVVLDVDLETARERMKGTPDRMEAKGSKYHRKVREGFLRLVEKFDSVVCVDASDNAEVVCGKVLEVIAERL